MQTETSLPETHSEKTEKKISVNSKSKENSGVRDIFLSFCFFVSGIFAYSSNKIYIFGIYLFILCFAVLIVDFLIAKFKKKELKRVFSLKKAFIFFFLFFISVLNCDFKIKNYDDLSMYLNKNDVELVCVVSSLPETSDENSTKFYAVSQNPRGKTLVKLNAKKQVYQKIKIGSTLKLKGYLKNIFAAKNPFQFDYKEYLKTKQVFSILEVNGDNFEIKNEKPSFKAQFLQKVNNVRIKIIEKHAKYIKSPNIELLGGIIFGDDASNPTEEVEESFKKSGLSHLLAASGLNVSLVSMLVFLVSMILKLPEKLRLLIAAFSVFIYTCMTGFPPSIVRSAIMIEFVFLGKFFNRTANTLNLIFISAILMLLYNPLIIRDIGFQLSFLVTFGLVFCLEIFVKKFNIFKIIFFSEIMTPIVSQIWVLPLQMFYFNTFTVYNVFSNLVVLPFISLVSFLGFGSCFVAFLPFENFLKFYDYVLNFLITIVISISDFFANLPNSTIPMPSPSVIQITLYYLLVICITLFLKKQKKYFAISSVLIFMCLCFSYCDFSKNKNLEINVLNANNRDEYSIKTPENNYIYIRMANETGIKDENKNEPKIFKKDRMLFYTNGKKDLNYKEKDIILYVKNKNIRLSYKDFLFVFTKDAENLCENVDVAKIERAKRATNCKNIILANENLIEFQKSLKALNANEKTHVFSTKFDNCIRIKTNGEKGKEKILRYNVEKKEFEDFSI